MDPPSHYRAPAHHAPGVTLREVTAPLGVGRAAALGLLAAGVVAALVPQATELECISNGAECKLVVHRGLFDAERALDARGITDVTTTGDPDLRLLRSAELLALQSDGRSLPLPSRGFYYDPRDIWRNDDRLVETARAFFLRREGSYFTVRQPAKGWPERVAFGVSLLAPLAGLAMLLRAERRTRWLRLTLDPKQGSVRARSVGLGGPSLDRTSPFGADARLQRVDDPGASQRPLLRVMRTDGATPTLLTGHAPEHRDAFDRLIARAQYAGSGGASADPSRALRVAPSALLALALVALVGRVIGQRAEIPATAGTIELACSVDRCETEGVTLLRGARMEWGADVGVSTRTFTVRAPGGATRAVTVTFEVRPGARTTFDCAALRAEEPLRVTPAGVRPAR